MNSLTHWGRVTHTYVSKRTIIGSDNGLSPDRRQAIIWTNAGMLLIGPSATTLFSENLIQIDTFSFTKMHLKMLSGKWWPCCLGLNVLTHLPPVPHIWTELGHHRFRWWLVPCSVSSHYLKFWLVINPEEQASKTKLLKLNNLIEEIALEIIIWNFATIVSRVNEQYILVSHW